MLRIRARDRFSGLVSQAKAGQGLNQKARALPPGSLCNQWELLSFSWRCAGRGEEKTGELLQLLELASGDLELAFPCFSLFCIAKRVNAIYLLDVIWIKADICALSTLCPSFGALAEESSALLGSYEEQNASVIHDLVSVQRNLPLLLCYLLTD